MRESATSAGEGGEGSVGDVRQATDSAGPHQSCGEQSRVKCTNYLLVILTVLLRFTMVGRGAMRGICLEMGTSFTAQKNGAPLID